MATRKQDSNRKIIDATLKLAAQRDWLDISLSEIASEAGVTLAAIHERFSNKQAIISAYVREVDAAVLADSDAVDMEGSARDRLFDVMMRRFDELSRHKAAIGNILDSYRCQPVSALCALPGMGRSMAWMLEAAGLSAGGWRGVVRVKGLSAIYLSVLRVWLKDESEDMAKTMAALDRTLARADSILGRLRTRRRTRSAEEQAAGKDGSVGVPG
ncbi:TetR family transcriptional regulator [Fodinicurvata fenggangensis]|uniref:TetR family transcriptional regulator n=1 Tax=Fodinicurvata fenggangensis TaxID=1121830 RepID=UPI00055851BA|nr:TetR family transcriptional regulator [Fodinicurvata fenggangensis]